MLTGIRLFGFLLRREFTLLLQAHNKWIMPVLLNVLIISLFAIAFAGNKLLLVQVATPVIWISLLLAIFFSTENYFQEDMIDGSLEQLHLWPLEMEWIVLCKVFVNWILLAGPVILSVPLVGVMLALSAQAILATFISLLMGSIGMSFIACLIASLTVGVTQSNAMLAIILLPLYIPVMILGHMWVEAVNMGQSMLPFTALFLSFDLVTAVLCPITTRFLLTVAQES